MNLKGPFVSVAALCDAILHEKDERISCIRFLDRLEIGLPPDTPENAAIPIQLNCFLAFKSGDFVGSKIATMKLTHPLGAVAKLPDGGDPTSYKLDFKGGEYGHNLILRMQIVVDQSGLFIFDVLLDDELMTRIPLRITITREQQNLDPQQHSQNV